MIITLIFIGILIGGIVLVCVGSNVKRLSWSAKDNIEFAGIFMIVVGIMLSLVTSGIAIGNAIVRDVNYQNFLYEKEMLEYRIERMDENITGNEMLYNDIVDFNNELRDTKKWANNPWVNWFYNQDIATIDYIEIDGH